MFLASVIPVTIEMHRFRLRMRKQTATSVDCTTPANSLTLRNDPATERISIPRSVSSELMQLLSLNVLSYSTESPTQLRKEDKQFDNFAALKSEKR